MAGIELEWDGKSYFISESEAFEVGEIVEDIATLPEIAAMETSPKFFKLARCFAAMLRFAGAQVTPQLVHKRMMDEVKSASESERATFIAAAVGSLVALLMDGAPEVEDDGDGKKKTVSGS